MRHRKRDAKAGESVCKPLPFLGIARLVSPRSHDKVHKEGVSGAVKARFPRTVRPEWRRGLGSDRPRLGFTSLSGRQRRVLRAETGKCGCPTRKFLPESGRRNRTSAHPTRCRSPERTGDSRNLLPSPVDASYVSSGNGGQWRYRRAAAGTLGTRRRSGKTLLANFRNSNSL